MPDEQMIRPLRLSVAAPAPVAAPIMLPNAFVGWRAASAAGAVGPAMNPAERMFHQKSRVSGSTAAVAAFQLPSRTPFPAVSDVPGAPSVQRAGAPKSSPGMAR